MNLHSSAVSKMSVTHDMSVLGKVWLLFTGTTQMLGTPKKVFGLHFLQAWHYFNFGNLIPQRVDFHEWSSPGLR